MNLLKELTSLNEAAVKDAMMAMIDKAISQAKVKDLSYDEAVSAIGKLFRKLDAHKMASKMSDEALEDMIMADYDEQQHDKMNEAWENDEGDLDKRAFKRNELRAELGHETNNVAIYIDGKEWKVLRGGIEGSTELRFAVDRARRTVDTLKAKGKKASYELTGSPVKEDSYSDSGDGYGQTGLDGQQQGSMPQGSSTSQQGPEVSQASNNQPPAPPKVIARGGQFKVELGADEQVSVIDGSGQTKLTVPLVIWQQLSRQQ